MRLLLGDMDLRDANPIMVQGSYVAVATLNSFFSLTTKNNRVAPPYLMEIVQSISWDGIPQ